MSEQNYMELVEKVNAILLEQEPGDISVDTYSGYIGYKPQYIKNAMNHVFGLGKWGYKEVSSEVIADAKGAPILVVSKVQVWIEGVEWRPEAWGQNRITKGDLGDAHKGADTDGMKKGLSDLSVGSRAFEGKLLKKDEYSPATDGGKLSKEDEHSPATEPQLATLRKLYHVLGMKMPQRDFTYDQAKGGIEKLTEAYRKKKIAPKAADPDSGYAPIDQISHELTRQSA